jgi:hypothetical protein
VTEPNLAYVAGCIHGIPFNRPCALCGRDCESAAPAKFVDVSKPAWTPERVERLLVLLEKIEVDLSWLAKEVAQV